MRRVTKYSMTRLVMVSAVTLAVGAVAGWYAGRMALEKAWSTGAQPLTETSVKNLSADDPDPVPKAGTLVLTDKPFVLARKEITETTAADRVKVRVAAVGNGDEGAELHVDVDNGATCTITEVAGVAHGYDATGRSVMLNKHGEHFVAFSANEQKIEPGAHAIVAQKLRYPETASLAIARIDSYACADGTRWARQ